MKQFKLWASAAAVVLVLAACGGGGDDPVSQPAKVSFTGYVNFGDSLSDVGSYKVGAVAAAGGGTYSINSPTALNWTAVVGNNFSLAAPCAAQTGLEGSTTLGFNATVTNVTTCFSYAQGGSRVTLPVGPGNKALGGNNALLGQLTVPVVTQVQNHLAKVGGTFTGKELITVLAGGNDLFIQSGSFGAIAGGASNPPVTGAAAVGAGFVAGWTTGTDAAAGTLAAGGEAAIGFAQSSSVAGMAKAGTELAGYVKTQMIAKGAKNIVVVNLPNVSKTPLLFAQSEQAKGYTALLANTFNTALKDGLAGAVGVVLVDAYAESTKQAANPTAYGFSNTTTGACGPNALGGNALLCNASNVKTGDVSKYQFADDVHPTPYGYEVLAKFVLSEMEKAGLL